MKDRFQIVGSGNLAVGYSDDYDEAVARAQEDLDEGFMVRRVYDMVGDGIPGRTMTRHWQQAAPHVLARSFGRRGQRLCQAGQRQKGVCNVQEPAPFRVIESDPPWKFGDNLPGPKRGAASHYPCMSVADLCAFPLPPLADDALLLLWRVASMQQEALDVGKAWGFKLKSEIVWEKTTATGKPHFGMGHYVRASHETCLVMTRGRWKPKSRSIRSRFSAPVGRHSEKPAAFYDLVEQLAAGPYCRLFARAERPGWTSFGNELEAA